METRQKDPQLELARLRAKLKDATDAGDKARITAIAAAIETHIERAREARHRASQ